MVAGASEKAMVLRKLMHLKRSCYHFVASVPQRLASEGMKTLNRGFM